MDIQEVEAILKIIRSSRLKEFADTLIKSAIRYAHISAKTRRLDHIWPVRLQLTYIII